MIYIIGGGGVGSWLAPAVCLLKDPRNVTIVDGDTLERKNMNRQLFDSSQIGQNKAVALSGKYGCRGIPNWYSFGSVEHERKDWLLVCVDNNAGRRSSLDAADRFGCQCIFAANETTSSSAYYYTPKWAGTKLDPRVYYPEILTDQRDDPRAAAIGCTGVWQEQTPQLVTSNAMAASLASHLFVLWSVNAPKLNKEVVPKLPFRLLANMSRLETHLIRDYQD